MQGVLRYFFLVTNVMLSIVFVHAQDMRQQFWMTYNAQQQLSKRWGYQFDLNHRLADVQQPASVISAVRIGGTYFTNHSFRLTAGYAWFGTHIHVKNHALLHENRLWQQAMWQYKKPKWKAIQRIRLEERWREQMNNGQLDHRFSVRLRYMWQWQYPVWHSTTHPQRQLMLHAADEWMLHAGDYLGKHFFDQNRLIGGLAYMANKQMELHLLYQYISQYQASNRAWQHINSIRLTLQHQL